MPALLVDRYELQRRIGSGGMATVWIALDRRLQREVAVKILSDTLAGDDQFRERFEREARRVASLSHPNIVVIHDFGVDGDSLFIVMELVRGMPLRRALLSSPLTPESTQTVARGILAGLGHAHQAGILHRDIKPGNILLTESGSAKLADFGIAKSIDDTIGLTDSGAILGSVSYASPEQLAGNALSPASDLYSLSCVLYECLAGRPPFVADNLVTLIARQQNEAPMPLRELAPSAPKTLTDTIMLGLVKDPEHRFATTEEMQTTLSSSPDSGRRLKDRPRRALRALPAPSGGIVPPSPPNVPAKDTRAEPTRPWWRSPVALIAAGVILVAALARVGAQVIPGHASSNKSVALSPAAPGYTPKLVAARCPSDVAGSGIHCNDLIVPQDRSHPKGRQVKLLVIRAEARTPHPAVDSVLDLGLFPFQGSVSDDFDGLSGKARLYSNYIALAQRGGAGSTPELSCPEYSSSVESSLALSNSDPRVAASQVSAWAACRKRLLKLGINPNDYGDDARVSDVRDLLSALHVTQVNLLGGNEESRVAYDLMRLDPAAIRSATLANPTSPSVDWEMNTTSSLVAALDQYQLLCNRSPECGQAYPDLKQQAIADINEFQNHPVTTDVAVSSSKTPIPVLIDGAVLDAVVDSAFVSGLLAPIASQIYKPNINIIADGIVSASGVFANQSHNPIWGAEESEYCKDQYPDDSSFALLNDQAADQSNPAFAGDDTDLVNAEQCRAWDATPDSANDFIPVSSAIPTFIVTGGVISASDYPAWVTQITSQLTHSVVLTFSTLADGTSSGTNGEAPVPSCTSSLELQFLRHPLASLDVKSCAAQSPAIDFSQ